MQRDYVFSETIVSALPNCDRVLGHAHAVGLLKTGHRLRPENC
jgi:hypothetical protein